MEPQRRDDDFDPRRDGGAEPQPTPQPQWGGGPNPTPQWDGSPDPRPMHERGGDGGEGGDDNLFMKYRGVWAVLITLITLLVCWQLLQVVLDIGI